MLCANCHREVHAGLLQLPQEIVVDRMRATTELKNVED